MPELEREIKDLIIATLKLEEVTPESIDSHAPIFGEGLGLDSIDALELGIAVQKKYGIKMNSDAQENRLRFSSVARLAAFVLERRAAAPENKAR